MYVVRVTFGVALQLLCFASVPSDANSDISGKIKLRFYSENQRYENKNYLERPLDMAAQLFSESKGYNRSLPLVLLVHGMAMGADSHFVNGIVQVLMKKKVHKTHNIFAVDMPEVMENDLNSKLYLGVLSNVKPSAKLIGGLLNFLISLKIISPEQINIIGYSMGTQVAGYIGRQVKATFGKIHYIAGLEPVGFGFHAKLGGKLPSLTHVSKDDAKITHFFHTNSHGLGSHSRDGTADFVFNNGNMQPGCDHYASLNCSHARAPYLYEEALLTPKQFVARSCETWHRFSNCQCEGRKTILIDFPPNPSAQGIYFLRTKDASPYGLGEKGSHCGPPDSENGRENMIDHSAAEEGSLFEYGHSLMKGLDLYGKKAAQSVGYFYKVLKGQEKNIDADYGEGEAEPVSNDTGNEETSGVNTVEPTKHPKTKSVKYEIEFKPHKKEPQGKTHNYAFSEEKSQHKSASKQATVKVSPLDINQDKTANKIQEDTLTKTTTAEPSKKDAADKKIDVNTPLEQVHFGTTTQGDNVLGNYGDDDVIVYEDSQILDGDDDESTENPKAPGQKPGFKEASLPTGNKEENKTNVKNNKVP